jgi:hypothetical protein
MSIKVDAQRKFEITKSLKSRRPKELILMADI